MFRWQQCPPQIVIYEQISKLRLQRNCNIGVVIFVVLQRVKLPEPLKKNRKKIHEPLWSRRGVTSIELSC